MTGEHRPHSLYRAIPGKNLFFPALVVAGGIAFLAGLLGANPERMWLAYLINFLLWSGIAQGAVLFSAVMHLVKARWSGPLSGLAESFAGFFPLSFILFLLLFFGRTHVFPWLGQDLHGKEVWLNIPFLAARDGLGLFVLYTAGFIYLFYALQTRLDQERPPSGLRRLLHRGRQKASFSPDYLRQRTTLWAGLYTLAFALVLSLIGFDLVMAANPHWLSTLFGGYTFIKAFYTGLGALIILACVRRLRRGEASGLTQSQFIDIGKLFFAFCLVWADFLYAQLVVIWYGNIPEETSYVITRVSHEPWQTVTWTVFILGFIIPFVVLLNRRVKARPLIMIVLCSLTIIAIWLEHLMLLGPALTAESGPLPLGISEVLIFLGFFGLLACSIEIFSRMFPENAAITAQQAGEGNR
ncbi:MAG: hypothetical protein K9K64_07875 [Desulfohalobiaceae bacterium]|nr:hypothetical protein [Desulfohalobiaceae bacterium]